MQLFGLGMFTFILLVLLLAVPCISLIGIFFDTILDTKKEMHQAIRDTQEEHLGRKQKVFRIVSLPFRWIGSVFSMLSVLAIVLSIIFVIAVLFRGIYNYIV